MRLRIKKLSEKYFEEKKLSKAIKWLDKFETIMNYMDTFESFCEEIVSYINIRNMNDSMKETLREMEKECPINNQALKKAFEECCPEVVVIKAAYQTSKYLTNLMFNTDEITEKYYKMIAAKELDDLMRDTYYSLKDKYTSNRTLENAKAYLSSIDLMFQTIFSDCRSAHEYVESLESAMISKICKLFQCGDNYSSLKSSINSIYSDQNLLYNSIVTSWILYLPEDFPEEYPYYNQLLEKQNLRTKKYQIHCPVDIYIYDSSDELVASVVNNIPDSSKITVLVNDDKKTIYLPENERYNIVYIGNDTGTMDVEITEYDTEDNLIRTANFNHINLSNGMKYTSTENGKFLKEIDYSIKDDNNNKKGRF